MGERERERKKSFPLLSLEERTNAFLTFTDETFFFFFYFSFFQKIEIENVCTAFYGFGETKTAPASPIAGFLLSSSLLARAQRKESTKSRKT